MVPSELFENLKQRVEELKTSLLPDIKLDGKYSKKQFDMMRGFRMLVHAEIEDYLETRVKEIAIMAFKEFKNNKKPNITMLSLMSFTDKFNCNLKKVEDTYKLEKRLNNALSHFINDIGKNHGIKEENILKMLIPIGIEQSLLDQTWLNDMNSFAQLRGDLAHKRASTKTQIDPANEIITVDFILDELRRIDLLVSSLPGAAP